MKLPPFAAVAMLLLGGVDAASGAAAKSEPPDSTPTPLVLPPSSKVDGMGYGELTGAWWQWAMATPVAPYLDPDGRFCDVGQSGAVWFLAGTDGSYDVRRQCHMPTGKHLLLPVINVMHSTALGARQGAKVSSCEELRLKATVDPRKLLSAVVLIDGIQVKDVASYRVRSEACFKLYPKVADDERFVTPTAASDGYWLLIPPLAPGRHTIVVGATYGSEDSPIGGMVQNFEYVLLVGTDGRSLQL